MTGRRIPVPENGDIFAALEQPGDYCGPAEGTTIHNNDRVKVQRVSFMLPGLPGPVFHCAEPPHQFKEEEDGTLTITPSILATHRQHGHEWHGYLTKGTWTTV
jgi:hypothetical protein